MNANWNLSKGQDGDVVISSRIRLARNLAGFSFPGKSDSQTRIEIRDQTENVLTPAALVNIHIEDLPKIEKQFLVERHLISEELAKGGQGQGVCISKDESISVMVNEEDHIRVQSMEAGFSLEKAYKKATDICILLEQALPIAYSGKYGFLTACPTNTGTGLRASVMAHLPALTASSKMRGLTEELTKAGFAVRGYQGEHSKAVGNIYQLSNQITLGVSESDILSGLSEMVRRVVEIERELRKSLYKKDPAGVEDSVYRSFGELLYARQMSEKEALRRISDLRLGVSLGFLKEVGDEIVARLSEIVGKAGIAKSKGEDFLQKEEEKYRADKIRQLLTDKK